MSTSSLSQRKRVGMPSFLTKDTYMTRLILILVLLLIFFAVVKPGPFFALRTWQSMAIQFPEFGLMALGVMLTMFTGGIDLSAVSIANVTSICTALILRATLTGDASPSSMGLAFAIALGVALTVGSVFGAFNGFLVSVLRIPPILATLGTMELFGGIAIILTGGKPVSGVPDAYGAVFAARIGIVPMPLIVFTVCALLIGLILALTGFGTKILLIGANEKAAHFSGLKIRSLLMRTYILSGILSAMAGLVMLANYNSAKADYGASYTLLTVLIVVLGGVNPNGGRGRIAGVVLAIVILQVLSSGLNMFPNISNFYRALIWGGVLLVVICANELNGKNPFKGLLVERKKA